MPPYLYPLLPSARSPSTTPPLTRRQQEPGQTKCQELGLSCGVGVGVVCGVLGAGSCSISLGVSLLLLLSLGFEGGFDGVDVDVVAGGGGGGGGGMRVFGSIWQRTRTSLGLWQRVQGLR